MDGSITDKILKVRQYQESGIRYEMSSFHDFKELVEEGNVSRLKDTVPFRIRYPEYLQSPKIIDGLLKNVIASKKNDIADYLLTLLGGGRREEVTMQAIQNNNIELIATLFKDTEPEASVVSRAMQQDSPNPSILKLLFNAGGTLKKWQFALLLHKEALKLKLL